VLYFRRPCWLEHDPRLLSPDHLRTISALNGEGVAESIAPDPLVTSRVAAHVSHYWTL
jgi:hypothetical protein